MFTGIIEEIGRLRQARSGGQTMVLTIEAEKVLNDIQLGDSIAINGVCLTVVSFDTHIFTVDVMPETYRKTNLSKLAAGARLNLERAMQIGNRFGGHIVQGHVDCTGTVHSRQTEENAVIFRIEPSDKRLFRYIIGHGSITIDGISLTVVEVNEAAFTVSIIPHTLAQTIMSDKHPGDIVNLEADILGKYIEHLMKYREPSDLNGKGPITKKLLAENGFV